MENVVYILGAGFSAPAGIPVMKEFIDTARLIYSQDKQKHPEIGKVLEAIDSMNDHYFKINVYDVEEVLSVVEIGQVLEKGIPGGNVSDVDIKKFINSVIQEKTPKIPRIPPQLSGYGWPSFLFNNPLGSTNSYGYFVCSLFQQFVHVKNASSQPPSEGYDYELGNLDTPTVSYSILTLNYDTLLEDFVDFINSKDRLPANDGRNIEFVDHYLTPDIRNGFQVPLIKIHGSIDKDNITPMTWNKGISESNPPIGLIEAFEALRDAHRIRILGYSLPESDTYFKYLLKAATLNAEHILSIDILGYNDNADTKDRFSRIVGDRKARWKVGSVEEYLRDNLTATGPVPGNNFRVECNRLEVIHQNYFKDAETIGG